jgi:hypothetical protein
VDNATAVSILEGAIKRLRESEAIRLALIDCLMAAKDLNRCRSYLETFDLSQSLPLSLRMARISEHFGGDIDFLKTCCEKFADCPDFWLMLSRKLDEPLPVLKSAVRSCPSSDQLQIALIKSAMKRGLPRPRIRALFEIAREASSSAIIWLFSAEFEGRENQNVVLEEAKLHVSKEELGMIWARQIELADSEARRGLAKEAMNVAGSAKELMLIYAICLWADGKVDQARAGLENVVREFPSWGDGWVFRLKFEGRFGDVNEVIRVLRMVKIGEGVMWRMARDDVGNFEMDDVELAKKLCDLLPDPMVSDCSIFGDFLRLDI